MIEIKDKDDIIFCNALIDFYSPTCAPCRKMMPILEQLEQESNTKFYKVNAVENPELVNRFGVQGLPTILVLEGGILEEKFVGLTSKSKIKLAIGE